jgi:hypothetical protein
MVRMKLRLDVMNEKTWVEHYYDALTFFYWEPQHLGRKKDVGARLSSETLVLKRLHSMEVTLNQIINQFLSLAPTSLRNLLFEQALGRPILGEFALSGRDFDKERPNWDTCQPDFQFISADAGSAIFIEMKVESHSRIEQVLKYAARALSNEQAQGQEMQSTLIFLGKNSFKAMWPRSTGITSVEELHPALLQIQDAFGDLRLKKADHLKGRFAEILSGMRFGFLSYEDFYKVLVAERELAIVKGSLLYVRLLDGMLKELRQRKLVADEALGE